MSDDQAAEDLAANFGRRLAEIEAEVVAQSELLKILRWRVYDQHPAPTKARTYDRGEAFKRLEAGMADDFRLPAVKHFFDELLEWKGRRDYVRE